MVVGPYDSTTDDAPSIQAAIDAALCPTPNPYANPGGGFCGNVVHIPQGVYRIAAPLEVRNQCIIKGIGGFSSHNGSVILPDQGICGFIVHDLATTASYLGTGTSARGTEIRNLMILGNYFQLRWAMPDSWEPNTEYEVGDLVTPKGDTTNIASTSYNDFRDAGMYFEVKVAGTTGPIENLWKLSGPCGYIKLLEPRENEYLVTENSPDAVRWAATTAYADGAFINEPENLFMWRSSGGTSGGSLPDFSSYTEIGSVVTGDGDIDWTLVSAWPIEENPGRLKPGIDGLVFETRYMPHGILAMTRIKVQDCGIYKMGGFGIHIAADVQCNIGNSLAIAGKAGFTEANHFHLENLEIQGCYRGVNLIGPDAQAGSIINVDVAGVDEWGIVDRGWVGSQLFGCQYASTGTADPKFGGAIRTSGDSAASVQIGAYSEGDGTTSTYLGTAAMSIGGFTGGGFDPRSTGWRMGFGGSSPFVVYNGIDRWAEPDESRYELFLNQRGGHSPLAWQGPTERMGSILRLGHFGTGASSVYLVNYGDSNGPSNGSLAIGAGDCLMGPASIQLANGAYLGTAPSSTEAGPRITANDGPPDASFWRPGDLSVNGGVLSDGVFAHMAVERGGLGSAWDGGIFYLPGDVLVEGGNAFRCTVEGYGGNSLPDFAGAASPGDTVTADGFPTTWVNFAPEASDSTFVPLSAQGGRLTVDMTGATYTLTAGERFFYVLEVADTSMGGAGTVTLPLFDGASRWVVNTTTWPVTFIGSSGTGVTLQPLQEVLIRCDGTNWYSLEGTVAITPQATQSWEGGLSSDSTPLPVVRTLRDARTTTTNTTTVLTSYPIPTGASVYLEVYVTAKFTSGTPTVNAFRRKMLVSNVGGTVSANLADTAVETIPTPPVAVQACTLNINGTSVEVRGTSTNTTITWNVVLEASETY